MAREISILLTAKDLASGNIRKVSGELGGLSRTGKVAALGLGGAGLAANKAAPAMRHLGGTVRGLAGGLGFLGVTLGATGLVGALTGAIARGSEFAKMSSDLASLMHVNVGAASALVDTLDDFGISGDAILTTLGRLNKNAQTLGGTTKANVKFQKEWGFSLVGTNGKLADSNLLLQRAADYYTSNATAGQKAVLMQKLFGKSWVTLIPLLKLGGKGVKDYTDKSIHLTKEQVKAAAAFEPIRREFSSVIDEIKIMAGLDVLPDVTIALRSGVHWLQAHKGEVRGWFRQGMEGAKQFAAFVTGTVIPTLSSIVGAAKTMWSGIPGPIKDLLLKGLVADRTVKFLFGISPGEMLFKGLGSSIASAIGGKLFQRGGSPASPLFVSPVGGAIGGAGGPGLISKGAGVLSKVVSIGAIVGSAFAVFETWQQQNESATKQATEIQKTATEWLKKQPSRADLATGLAGVEQGIHDITSNPLLTLVQGEALDKLRSMQADIRAQLAKIDANTATGKAIIGAVQKVGPAVSNALNSGGIVGAILSLIPHIDNIKVPGYNPQAPGNRGGTPRRRNTGTPSGPPGSNLPGYSPPTRHGGGRAGGGPVWPGASFTVGEGGRERLDMFPGGGGRVTPLGGSGAMTISVPVIVRSSAREAHKTSRTWRRYGGNGSVVTLD